MNIIEAMTDKHLFGSSFAGDTWRNWQVFLKGLYALPMTKDEQLIFLRFTGWVSVPTVPVSEAFPIIGRKGGKSRIAGLIGVHTALLTDFWKKSLAPGERALAVIIATDRSQAQVIFQYARALVRKSPLLHGMIERETREELHFTNGASLCVKTPNFRSVRGFSVVCAICDELAFWYSDITMCNPAGEVLGALRPAITKGGLLLGISSAYARSGVLWDEYERHFGKDGKTLVWLASTRDMNPSFDQGVIDEAMARDAAAAASEYYSEWRDNSGALLSGDSVDLCIVKGRGNLPYKPRLEYRAFCDPSGGQHDCFSLAIAHLETKRTDEGLERTVKIVDFVKEVKPPFSPSAVVYEFSEILKTYGLFRLSGDRYGCAWVSEVFRQCGIRLDYSELSASELFLNLLAEINSGGLELPDDKALRLQLLSLLRKPGQAGHDRVIAPATNNGHCDLANSTAGAAHLLQKRRQMVSVFQ